MLSKFKIETEQMNLQKSHQNMKSQTPNAMYVAGQLKNFSGISKNSDLTVHSTIK